MQVWTIAGRTARPCATSFSAIQTVNWPGAGRGRPTRCGKPACHCASQEGPLHSSTVLSWSEHGQTRLRTLPAGERARFQQWTENYRRFRQARAALVKLQRRMLAAIDRLEKTLRLPPPQPAARRRKP